jgi:hypothetical protein
VNLSKHKTSLWVIAIWFAAMQAFAPFIHGHLDTDESSHAQGMHFHDDHDHVFPDQSTHKIHDGSHLAHTVVIATGIKKDTDSSIFTAMLLVLAFILFPFQQPVSVFLRHAPVFNPLFRRRPSSPRAPPPC